jgi:hypothetical protein
MDGDQLMSKPKFPTWQVLFVVASFMFAWFVAPASTQQPVLVQLGDSGGSTQTQRAATLANFATAVTLTARPALGVQVVTKPSSWTVVSAPAANAQGSASIAAEAAVRHVADCVSFSGDAAAAVTAAAGSVVIRDGATGAGTIIWQLRIAHLVAAAAGIQTIAAFGVCGLNLVGTTNTAMTAEFNAGVTGEEQAITITGYNVQ